MVQKTKGQKVYKTMQGKTVDMDMLRKRNELTPAVGNAKINARGDELGPGGQIIRKREDVVKEYYENNKGVVDQKAVKNNPPEKDLTDDWVEDEDGNFIQKGE
jgi:hypothetical protein|tara:strand:- start:462 stop:770 length:309 start_codon:yes stop_codon:yes gene_type:complete